MLKLRAALLVFVSVVVVSVLLLALALPWLDARLAKNHRAGSGTSGLRAAPLIAALRPQSWMKINR